jgi:hypothetical protein
MPGRTKSSADSPLAEEQIHAAWIDQPPRLSGPILLAESDPKWTPLCDRNQNFARSLA